MQPDLFESNPLVGSPALISIPIADCITTGSRGYCMGMWVYIHAIDGDNAVCETSQSCVAKNGSSTPTPIIFKQPSTIQLTAS